MGDDDSDDDCLGSRRAKPMVDRLGFDVAVAASVIAYVLAVGIGTDAPALSKGLWDFVEMSFIGCFTLELFFRLTTHGRDLFLAYGRAGNRTINVVDFLAVFLGVLDIVLRQVGHGSILRFVPLLRLVRVLNLVKHIVWLEVIHVDRLWLVINGLSESAQTLFWICLVVACFLYVCAVLVTNIVGHRDDLYDPYFVTSGGWDHEAFFGTIPQSMFTLIQIMTLDGWCDSVARHVAAVQPGMSAFFVLFIVIASWGLVSLFVSIIIEGVITAARKESDNAEQMRTMERQKVFHELRGVFQAADTDESGMVTLEEMAVALGQNEIYNKLKMIDFPVDDPEKIFVLLDYDESGELSIDEFITGCIRMRGSANSKDLLVAQVAVDNMKKRYNLFEEHLGITREKVLKLQSTTTAMIKQGERVFLDQGEYRRRHPEMDGVRAEMPRIQTAEVKSQPWGSRPGTNQIPDSRESRLALGQSYENQYGVRIQAEGVVVPPIITSFESTNLPGSIND